MENEILKCELCALYGTESVREVDATEYDTLEHYKRMTVFFLHFEDLYEIVKENFRDFWRTLFDVSEDYRLHILRGRPSITKDISNLNLRIMNILNSVKAYDTHLRHQLISNFGGEQNKYLDCYKKLTSDVYDNSFEYRFCVRLRNYTQHMRNPVDKISYHSYPFRTEPMEMAFTATPIVFKNRLMEFKKWSTVKKDIEALDDETDLVPIFELFFKALSYIHSNMRKGMEDVYQECKQWIIQLYSECEEFLKSKHISTKPSPNFVCQYSSGVVSSEWIPYELIETIEEFRGSNANFSPQGISFSTLQPFKGIKKIQDMFFEAALRNTPNIKNGEK